MKDNLTLKRMWGMLEKAGNPHEKLKVIHVAGTSGKTSTCYYVSALLNASGKKTGLTVSPHILSITERVQINTVPISEKKFCDYLEEFDALMGDTVSGQSYFEFMIVFALWVFVQEKVDYAVLETGLGGLHDSTNVVTREDKVCVLTDIGYDHQHILGDTLEEIAEQKAGIIHEGNHAFSFTQETVVNNVYKNKMKLKNATFTSVIEKNGVKYEGLPEFQSRNFFLAKKVTKYVAKRDGFKLVEVDPRKIVIPGRMQQLTIRGKELLIDGAHNPQKMKAFVESVTSIYPGRKFDIVVAMRKSKDYKATVRELVPIVRSIICSELTSYDVSSIPAEIIEETCRELDLSHTVEKEITKAVQNGTTNPTIVTGSLYLLSAISKPINTR